MKKRILYTVLLILFLYTGISGADVRLPSVISDRMVIQQNTEVKIWGWAEPGENIEVRGNWMEKSVSAFADEKGDWIVGIQSPEAGGPYRLTIKGKNEIVLKDVLAGEVWFASGQSNMAFALRSCENAKEEIAKADYPLIRLFHIERTYAEEPQKDCNASWDVCKPETVKGFSGAAYYFGRKIHKELNVPVGLISASKGGSPCEAWMRKDALESDTELLMIFDMWKKWEHEYPEAEKAYQIEYETWEKNKETAEASGEPVPKKLPMPEAMDMVKKGHRRPGALYNAMVVPVLPYTIKGVIWYQGTNNMDRPVQYRKLFPALIRSWREDWDKVDLPFYYVQNAPYRFKTIRMKASLLREAQSMAMSLPHTGMVVTSDIGELDNNHPKNKRDVGKRLALWALAKTYGDSDLVYSGPIYKTMKIEEDKIRLYFDHTGSGLKAEGERLTHFEIAGPDKIFFNAVALIEDTTVIVHSKNVPNPVAVRYGWSITSEPNFYNKENLPAVPFRTDNWNSHVKNYDVVFKKDIPYLSSERKEKLDIYYPDNLENNELFPGIVIIHGGGFYTGDKAKKREKNIGNILAQNGFVCISINYVLVKDQPTWPQPIKDCKTAVQFLNKNGEKYRIDPGKIGVIGSSAGGHLALMTGFIGPEAKLEPEQPYPGISTSVKAVVDLYGITNLLTRQEIDKNGRPLCKFKQGKIEKFLGVSLKDNPGLWELASPVNHISPDDPPVLILHGTKDNTIDYLQSIELAEKLAETGVEHALHFVENVGHTFSLQYDSKGNKLPDDLSLLVIEFFNKHLKYQ
jgi:sialate O-acetylesterase